MIKCIASLYSLDVTIGSVMMLPLLLPSDALCHEAISNCLSVGETMDSLQPSCSEPVTTTGHVNTMGQIDLKSN